MHTAAQSTPHIESHHQCDIPNGNFESNQPADHAAKPSKQANNQTRKQTRKQQTSGNGEEARK
jgi:hypothetical protein